MSWSGTTCTAMYCGRGAAVSRLARPRRSRPGAPSRSRPHSRPGAPSRRRAPRPALPADLCRLARGLRQLLRELGEEPVRHGGAGHVGVHHEHRHDGEGRRGPARTTRPTRALRQPGNLSYVTTARRPAPTWARLPRRHRRSRPRAVARSRPVTSPPLALRALSEPFSAGRPEVSVLSLGPSDVCVLGTAVSGTDDPWPSRRAQAESQFILRSPCVSAVSRAAVALTPVYVCACE